MRRIKWFDHAPPALSALVPNVYTGPSLDRLQRKSPNVCFLFGEMEISGLEIRTGITNEGAFIALLAARLQSTLDEMVEALRAPSFPVHDEPLEAA